MTSGTLVMLHGMTGTTEKMQPLAERLAPEGWAVLCPQAEIEHPTRGGFAWWLRAEDPSLPLSEESQSEVDNSMRRVIDEIPDGPIIIGGFSQGGAIASVLLESELQERILGLVLIGTKSVRPESLTSALPFLKPREVVWMHGRHDHLVSLEAANEHAEIFEWARWPVTRLEHEKGHMVNMNQIDELKQAIQRMVDSA
ncbi:MAG: alpha/beta fold hydrolase [Candidatus Thermoplasmatota archaeon]|nr:alpha/beta fold hydrolase [Candidatus Thermoplasmatota archaeon]MEC9351054.1 alpha/beta fold hydrolase [Candidatus Thermoplasmatota archaeon]